MTCPAANYPRAYSKHFSGELIPSLPRIQRCQSLPHPSYRVDTRRLPLSRLEFSALARLPVIATAVDLQP